MSARLRFLLLVLMTVIIPAGIPLLSCAMDDVSVPSVRDGVMDITSVDLSRNAVQLTGRWEFYRMRFISTSPKENPGTPDTLISVPGAWNNVITAKEKPDGSGYASYRMKIISKEKGLVGFDIPEISSAYRLWVNNELIASAGTPGNSPRDSSPSSARRNAYFYSDGTPFTVTMHVSNFQHARGGILRPIIFGTSSSIHAAAGKKSAARNLITGGLGILALSFIIFFYFRRDEKNILLLASILILTAFASAMEGGTDTNGEETVLPWITGIKIRYIIAAASAYLFAAYTSGIGPDGVSKKSPVPLRIILWTGCALALAAVLSPVSFLTRAHIVFAVYVILCAALSLRFLHEIVARKDRGGASLFAGFACLIAALANDMLNYYNIITTGFFSPGAFLIFAVIQSVIVALNYSSAVSNVELLSKQLKANNTMIKKLNEQIDHKNREMTQRLYTDRLTGLPNRQSLFVDIHATSFPTMLLIDIDAFKEINDFYGNRIGDFVLKEAAVNMAKIINPETSRLYKLSVDEYAILIDDEKMDSRAVTYLANSLSHEISIRPIMHGTNEIFIRITIGGALGALIDGKKTFEDIIVRADMALKQAKRFAKTFLLYNESMEIIKEYEKNMNWARKLKHAVETDRIIPYYQPITNTATGNIEKFECLIRLTDDDGTIISPFQFLEIARKCRLYTELTKIMVDKAFAAFKQSTYEFSLNIAMDDILDVETREFIIGVLLMNRDTAPRAIFEILESQDIENYSEVKDFLAEVKSYGCRIAVDDFGSGYSNFEHIMKLNVDFIKIDASLVKNVHVDRNSRVIVKTISVFAKELGIKTVAEFVHCKEVLDSIKELGIDYAQGYHLGEPKGSIV